MKRSGSWDFQKLKIFRYLCENPTTGAYIHFGQLYIFKITSLSADSSTALSPASQEGYNGMYRNTKLLVCF